MEKFGEELGRLIFRDQSPVGDDSYIFYILAVGKKR